MSYVPLGWKNYGRLGKDRGRIFFELYWWPNGGKTVFLWEKSSPESEFFLMIYNFTSWIPIHPILQQKPSAPHQSHFPCFLLHPFQQSLPPFFKASWSFWPRCKRVQIVKEYKGSSIKNVGCFYGRRGIQIANVCQLEGVRGLRNADVSKFWKKSSSY